MSNFKIESNFLFFTLFLLSTNLCFGQDPWSKASLSFGFSRVGITNSSLDEGSVFNPNIQFEFSYSRSIYQFIGLKASIAHSNQWIYTRASFDKVGNETNLGVQEGSRLNTYIRSNAIRAGIGPQFRLYKNNKEEAFLSFQYIPTYLYANKLQYKVSGDTKTYGEDLNSNVDALRHNLQLDVTVVKDREVSKGFLNSLTFFAGIDLNGYTTDNKFRPTYLGIMFGF